jgi:hypothetical protein
MKRRLEDSTLDLIFIRKERKFSISLTLSAQKSYLKFPAEEADNVVVSELADIRQCNKLNNNASLLEYGLGIHSSSFDGDNEDATKLLIVIARASLLSTKPKTLTTTGSLSCQQTRPLVDYYPSVYFDPNIYPKIPQLTSLHHIICFNCHLPGYFTKHCPYKIHQYTPNDPSDNSKSSPTNEAQTTPQ